ncbi:MAG TPA: hypothetical protein VFE62_19045 [Gemmataceae bacterium]|nr:hypothetical protein [Gemmataceae bacterium]
MRHVGPGLIALALVVVPSDAGDREIMRITGTMQLPAGARYPARAQVKIELAKIEPGKVITFYRVVGSQELGVIKSTPVQFKVPYTKASLKNAPAASLVLCAKVYDVGASPRKLLYEIPLNEAVPAFTDAGQPRQNVTLALRTPAPK